MFTFLEEIDRFQTTTTELFVDNTSSENYFAE